MIQKRGTAALLCALTATVIALAVAAGANAVQGGKFRPAASTTTGGVVATESLEASRVARAVLARGGNAMDAAVAGTLAIGVARPQSCGIGGGGFLVHRTAGGRVDSLDFREVAPAAVRPDTFAGPGPHKQFTGQRTVGVPGTVAGLEAALERHGTISLSEAVVPAIELATEGVEVTPSLSADMARNSERLRRFPESAKIFLAPGNQPYPRGAVLKQPELARTLDGIRLAGSDYFYRGAVAEAIVASMATAPQQLAGDAGLMTAEDLAAYRPTWRKALTGTYRGHGVVAMPPPTSGGVAILEMLNLLEGFDLRAAGQSSADALHLIAEAQKLAFADRGAYVADPDQVRQPTAVLTSKEYAARRRGEIDPARAKTYQPGDVSGATARREGRDFNPRGSTTHLSVIDNRGNAVALTCTIEQSFGSAVTAPGTGVLLNNELTYFSDPGTANQPGPGKTPRSSMSPTIVTRNGRPVLAVGGAGGARIIEGVLLSIVNFVDYGQDIAGALDTERIDAGGATLSIEEGRIPVPVRDELQRRGHRLAPKGEYDVTPRLNAAGFTRDGGLLTAASDPRTDNGALTTKRAAKGKLTRAADRSRPRVAFREPERLRDRRGRPVVDLFWRARDRGTGPVTSAVQVRRRLDGGRYAPWSTVSVDKRAFSIRVSSPQKGRRVQFRVRVTDRAGNVSNFDELDHRF